MYPTHTPRMHPTPPASTQIDCLLFAVVDCGTLVDPGNGMVDITEGTILGNTAQYTCFEGFRLVGPESRTCAMSGRWTGTDPICERKKS